MNIREEVILIPEQTLSSVSLISPPWGFMGEHAGEDYIREIKKSAHLHIAR